MKKIAILVLVFLILAACATICVSPVVLVGMFKGSNDGTAQKDRPKFEYKNVSGNPESENKILSIKIFGPIYNESEGNDSGLGGLLGSSSNVYGYDVKETLKRAADDTSIKGVMIEVNSPGGTITGSQAISDGIKYYQDKTHKPVIGFGSGVVASGGYWVISQTDEIVLDYGSLIGSIGVIAGNFTVYNGVIAEDGGLLNGGTTTKDGIEHILITAGEGKDIGNPYRKPTEKELQIMRENAQSEYTRFVDHVSERRVIDKDVIKNQIGAYIYSNEKAKILKLMDETGNREDAYALMAKKANLSDYQVVKEQTPEASFLQGLLGAVSLQKDPPKAQIDVICGYTVEPLFMYSLETVCKK